jgi:glycosyltransferase involved in cell wall biosynthesis
MNGEMNILVVPPDFESGGVISVVRNLTTYLSSRGYVIRLFYSGSSILARHRENEFGFPAVDQRLQVASGERLPGLRWAVFFVLFPLGLFQLLWRLLRWRIQVVNIHYPVDSHYYFAICRRILKFTLVCSIHGADVFPEGKPSLRYSRELRMLLRHSDWIVTPSEDCRRRLADVFPQHRSKMVCIHNGIDLAKFSNSSQATTPVKQGRYILSVSAYKDQKGLDVLIRAMKTVAEHHPEVKLVLVGEGPLLEDLELLSEKLGLSNCVEFQGRKTHDEVVQLLHGCEAFVLPSRFETFGIALVEAMACGRAVVATNAGGMPEIVRNGINGLLVKAEDPSGLADALNTLLYDASLRQRLGETAVEDVHRCFPANSTGAAYERIFRAESKASCRNQHADESV